MAFYDMSSFFVSYGFLKRTNYASLSKNRQEIALSKEKPLKSNDSSGYLLKLLARFELAARSMGNLLPMETFDLLDLIWASPMDEVASAL